MKPLRIALFFGGQSVEHEISIITALQAFDALDTSKYEVIPVYLSPKGAWYTGAPLFKKSTYSSLKKHVEDGTLSEVTILPHNSAGKGLWLLKKQQLLSVDACLLCFHGSHGENGCIQGLLELAGLPYTGFGVLASAVAMHKPSCKALAKSAGIPVLPSISLRIEEVRPSLERAIENVLATPGLNRFPLFVKPANLGSSIAIAKVEDKDALGRALANLFLYDYEALIEPCVEQLMEVNISVLSTPRGIQTSVTEVPVAQDGVLSYEDKYLRKGDKFGGSAGGMASLTRMIDPKDLASSIKEEAADYARRLVGLLDGNGVVRIDFIYDLKEPRLYFNELNSIPGSLSYYLWEKTPHQGQPHFLYTDLLDELIEGAITRAQRTACLKSDIGFLALK